MVTMWNRINQVLVFLLALIVYDNCQTVSDLTTEDLTAHPEGCKTEMDLLFIFDTSVSIIDSDPIGKEGLTWARIKNFTNGLVMKLPVGANTSVAAIRYGSRANVEFHLDNNWSLSTLSDTIMSMDIMGGNTNTAEAFKLARNQVFTGTYGARASARNVVIFIGDGISNRDVHITDKEVSYLKSKTRSNAEVFTVGVSREILDSELIKIASPPVDKHFMHAETVDHLPDIQDLLLYRICDLPDPFVPTSKPVDCIEPGCKVCDENECFACVDGKYLKGGKCRDCVPNCKICSNSVMCERCMTSWYWEPATDQCEECELVADLGLVIDNSGSIRDKNPEDQSYDNYNLLKNFINRLLDRLDIAENTTRVAAVKFSSMATPVFPLDRYWDREEMHQAILQMGYGGGHTNISGGLRMMREDIFREATGDRRDVGNIALLITDGESTIDKNLTDMEATLIKNRGITLFVVGVTDEINEEELKSIASPPVDEHYFNSTDIRYLDDLLHSLTKHVCAQKSNTIQKTIAKHTYV